MNLLIAQDAYNLTVYDDTDQGLMVFFTILFNESLKS